MRKPSRPNKPPEPKEPSKYLEVRHSFPEDLWKQENKVLSMKAILASLPEGVDDIRCQVLCRYDERSEYGESGYYLDCWYSTQDENPDYATEHKRYLKKLETHKAKMKTYEEKLVKYEEDLKVYQAWEKEEEKKEEAAELEELKKRIKVLEKKTAK
jgi:hypothetical protein